MLYQTGRCNTGDGLPPVFTFDIEACNGVIHIVDKVLSD
jgi:hypothetical protein